MGTVPTSANHQGRQRGGVAIYSHLRTLITPLNTNFPNSSLEIVSVPIDLFHIIGGFGACVVLSVFRITLGTWVNCVLSWVSYYNRTLDFVLI